jgi:hypothetical protein
MRFGLRLQVHSAMGLRSNLAVVFGSEYFVVKRLARRMLILKVGKGRTSSEAPDSHWSRERATWRFLAESEELVVGLTA